MRRPQIIVDGYLDSMFTSTPSTTSATYWHALVARILHAALAPGAAALAGLLRLASVYGRFGVFASSWLWGAFCRWPCPVLGFPLVFRFVMGYTLLCSFAGCRCWAPAPGAAALAGLLRLTLVYGRFGVRGLLTNHTRRSGSHPSFYGCSLDTVAGCHTHNWSAS